MNTSIIFDMDGTLFRTETILEKALDETFHFLCKNEGWEGDAPIEQYREIMGVPLPVVWETLLPNYSMSVRAITDDYFLNRLIENIRSGNGELYPGVVALFEKLISMNCTLYIASNGLIPYLEAIVSHYGLHDWITATYSIEQIETLNKSDLVAHILTTHNIQDGFVVGDRLSDIAAAKANGLVSIGCRFDFSQEEELQQADYVVNQLVDIPEIVATRRVLL